MSMAQVAFFDVGAVETSAVKPRVDKKQVGDSVKLEGECARKAACLALVGGHEHMDEVALRAARIQGVALGTNARHY